MNHKELIATVNEDILKATAQEKEAWEVITNPESVDSARYRAMFVIQYAVGIKNAALAFIDKLEQVEAQNRMSTSSGIRV